MGQSRNPSNNHCSQNRVFRVEEHYLLLRPFALNRHQQWQAFDSSCFQNLCSQFNINIFFASPTHPQSNIQVEAINEIIKKTLKKKLGAAKGEWPDILPEALWAINNSYQRFTGEMPFSLAFGIAAIVPMEINAPTCKTTSEPEKNEAQLTLNHDHRVQAHLRNAAYKQRTSRVKSRSFKIGDWVVHKVSLATKNPAEGFSTLHGKASTK